MAEWEDNKYKRELFAYYDADCGTMESAELEPFILKNPIAFLAYTVEYFDTKSEVSDEKILAMIMVLKRKLKDISTLELALESEEKKRTETFDQWWKNAKKDRLLIQAIQHDDTFIALERKRAAELGEKQVPVQHLKKWYMTEWKELVELQANIMRSRALANRAREIVAQNDLFGALNYTFTFINDILKLKNQAVELVNSMPENVAKAKIDAEQIEGVLTDVAVLDKQILSKEKEIEKKAKSVADMPARLEKLIKRISKRIPEYSLAELSKGIGTRISMLRKQIRQYGMTDVERLNLARLYNEKIYDAIIKHFTQDTKPPFTIEEVEDALKEGPIKRIDVSFWEKRVQQQEAATLKAEQPSEVKKAA